MKSVKGRQRVKRVTNVRKVWACTGGAGSQTLRAGEEGEEGEGGGEGLGIHWSPLNTLTRMDLGFKVYGLERGGKGFGGSRGSDVAGGGGERMDLGFRV